jgi:hypothetical protein
MLAKEVIASVVARPYREWDIAQHYEIRVDGEGDARRYQEWRKLVGEMLVRPHQGQVMAQRTGTDGSTAALARHFLRRLVRVGPTVGWMPTRLTVQCSDGTTETVKHDALTAV